MRYTLFFLLMSWLPLTSEAQQDYSIRKKHFNVDKSGLAVQGYDVVSYFEDRPILGVPSILLFHKGVKYLFVSESHLEEFKMNPSKYEPSYGGWCAYAMGKTGEKVAVDPTKYKIVNGHIHLFYYTIFNNTLTKWNAEELALKLRADQNWNTIIKQQ